ncbi:3558_t:CDS:2, partial [Acaulospora morrowiae]
DPEHWTAEQCNDLRSIMENFVYVIRWPYISGNEFSKNVVPYSKIFPEKFYKELVKYYVNPNESLQFRNFPKRVGKLESNLISIKHMNLISQWIKTQHNFILQQTKRSDRKMQYHYNLLIRGSRDGFSKSDFQRACQYMGPTIMIVKLEKSDVIIGGYNPLPWSTSNKNSIHARKSFIFAFDNDYNDPVMAGKLCKPKNIGTYPVISITDDGLKFGLDLTLKFADSNDLINSTLSYRNIEYTLLGNVQRQFENPINIEDFEIFSVHDTSNSDRNINGEPSEGVVEVDWSFWIWSWLIDIVWAFANLILIVKK